MADSINEKRKYLRLDAVNIVKVTPDKKSKKKVSGPVSALTKNISVEGVCFVSDKPFDKNECLRLEIYLSEDSKPLRIRGQVRWTRPIQDKNKTKKTFEVGVKLFTVDESDSTRFMGYVCRYMAGRLGQYLHL